MSFSGAAGDVVEAVVGEEGEEEEGLRAASCSVVIELVQQLATLAAGSASKAHACQPAAQSQPIAVRSQLRWIPGCRGDGRLVGKWDFTGERGEFRVGFLVF